MNVTITQKTVTNKETVKFKNYKIEMTFQMRLIFSCQFLIKLTFDRVFNAKFT